MPKKDLEKCVKFYKFLKENNHPIEIQLGIIELDDFEELSDDAWEMLNDCGEVILKLETCNGLSKEILKKLSINRKIIYQFFDDNNKEGYSNDDLFMIYQILETLKYVTEGAENNIHKIMIVCNIITWLVWYDSQGVMKNEHSTKEKIAETRSLKGSFFKGGAVCLGYALTLKIILNYLGIETNIIGGYGLYDGKLEFHAWNQVKDDIFYNLDLTYDWQAVLSDLPFNNLLKSDEEFYKNHSTNVSWEDYTQLQKCPKSIPNLDLRYYSKSIPEDLRKFLVKNQSKGLYKILEYRQHFFEQENPKNKGK